MQQKYIGNQHQKPTILFATLLSAVVAGDLNGQPLTAAHDAKGEKSFEAYITGYSYWDNTPAGSAAISHPVIHQKAGGTGTYADPVTIAVGHVISGRRHSLDYPAGTRFYIAHLRKYAIVEDTCGDGDKPQNGPCHIGHRGRPWLDIYVDGSRIGPSASEACMNSITAVRVVIENPGPDYPVVAGAISETACRQIRMDDRATR